MSKSLQSKFDCYCGFSNTIVFIKPTVIKKAWLEQDCLKCGARYDLRIYQDKDQLKLYKRLIRSSDLVNQHIINQAHTDATISNFKFKENGVLDGKTADKRTNSKDGQGH